MLRALRLISLVLFGGTVFSIEAAEILTLPRASAPRREVIGEVLEFGTFKLQAPAKKKKSKTTPDGYTIEAPNAKFTRYAEAIEMLPGLRFGFRFRIRNLPDQREVVLRTVVRHPPMRLPSGKTRDHYEKETRLPVFDGAVIETTGYGLDHTFEQVPGRWTFEHWYGDRLVVSQSFTVLSHKEELDRRWKLANRGSLPRWFLHYTHELPRTTSLAILLVSTPGRTGDPSNLQTQTRYFSLWNGTRFEFQPKDAELWKAMLLENETASIYGRMIAAGFLLRVNDPDARQFLEAQLRSHYRRYNHNAACVLLHEFAHNPDDIWIQDRLIELLQDERLLDSRGDQISGDWSLYEEGDKQNLESGMFTSLCANLGREKCKRAVPALMHWVDSQEWAIKALGDIGDESIAPELMKRLGQNEYLDRALISTLGQLHYQPVAPVAIQRLEAGLPADSSPDDDCLKTLVNLKSKEAIPIIKAWAALPKIRNRPLVERVLAQLENEDPIPALLEFLKDEKSEYAQCDLIRDLAKTRSTRVLWPLIELAKTSPHPVVRGNALHGLGTIGSDESLRALVELSHADFADKPVFKATTAREVIANTLEGATKQRLYLDFAAWETWLRDHPGFPEMAK